jgi:hypothetical protein
MNTRVLPALLVAAAAAGTAFAWDRDDGRRGGPAVILYEHADFRGGAVVLRPGEAAENLARWDFDDGRRSNDRVSSIRVVGGAEAMVFTDANFRGEALRVAEDIRDLGVSDRTGPRFNDRISSVRVEWGRGDGGRPGRPGNGRPPAATPPVDVEKLVRRSFQDVLEREPDAEGMRYYRSLVIERGWTEREIRDALRRSEEYRGPYMTRRLNRLYREVLGRDVDERGFDHYRNKIIEHGWGDDDIRRDLRNSAEFRNRPRTANP